MDGSGPEIFLIGRKLEDADVKNNPASDMPFILLEPQGTPGTKICELYSLACFFFLHDICKFLCKFLSGNYVKKTRLRKFLS